MSIIDTTTTDISVGIVAASEIELTLHGDFSIAIDGRLLDEAVSGSVKTLKGKIVTESGDLHFSREVILSPVLSTSRFTLLDVMIGIGFHWQRTEPQTFEGTLVLVREGEKIRAINRINVERYLTSVISSEMNASCPPELLKAHAVMSRSWLVAQLRSYRASLPSKDRQDERMRESDAEIVRWFDRDDHTEFDVCADDHCQRYQGITRAASPQVAEAVAATAGVLLLAPSGRVADARFSKCCGGTSELFSTCWGAGGEEDSYLTSVSCPWCAKASEHPQLLKLLVNSYDSSTTPDFYSWTVAYTAPELTDLIRRRSGIDFGRIRCLKPGRRGPSGRMVSLTIVGEKRTLTVGKELMIRRWLSESHLFSSAFSVETEGVDAYGYPLRFILHGRGWGHGVGLCQIGAAVMATEGHDWRAILHHYFPNATLSDSNLLNM